MVLGDDQKKVEGKASLIENREPRTASAFGARLYLLHYSRKDFHFRLQSVLFASSSQLIIILRPLVYRKAQTASEMYKVRLKSARFARKTRAATSLQIRFNWS